MIERVAIVIALSVVQFASTTFAAMTVNDWGAVCIIAGAIGGALLWIGRLVWRTADERRGGMALMQSIKRSTDRIEARMDNHAERIRALELATHGHIHDTAHGHPAITDEDSGTS